MKGNEEIEKIGKYSQKPLELCTNLYVCLCVCVCVCVFVLVIVAYYYVWTSKWCLVYVCVKIHMQHDKPDAVFRMGERCYSKLSYSRAEKNYFFLSLCICVHINGGDYN